MPSDNVDTFKCVDQNVLCNISVDEDSSRKGVSNDGLGYARVRASNPEDLWKTVLE